MIGPRNRLLALVAIAWIIGLTGAVGAAQTGRPNVLIIMTDDQGYGDLGCHGNPHIQTPALDRLFAQSTRLTRFYAMPVCTPTRAALMTGRYAYRTRAFDTLDGRATIDPDEVTLAEIFRAAGYRTAILGKWHLGDNYPSRSIDQGFEESLIHRGGGIAHYSDWPDNAYSDPILTHNGKPEKYQGYCTDIFASALIQFIERHRDEPMLLYFAANVPHDPLQVPDEHVEPFKGKGLGEENPLVYGMMKNFDDNVAKVLGKLDELDLARKTIVIYLSDNGPAMQLSDHDLRFNANLRGEKKQVYEGGIRVPCFIRWPDTLPAGREIDRIASIMDVLPTLCDATGISPPANVKLDGKSLWPLLSGAQSPESWPDRTIHFQWHRGNAPEPFRNAASRTQQYKLVNGVELYDLNSDPQEKTDIASQHPQIVAGLRAEYEKWLADVSATRGFDPTLIQIGTDHENPTALNPNDWRRDDPNAKEFKGYWPVQVDRAGRYSFLLRAHEGHAPPAQVHLKVGEIHRTADLVAGQLEYAFDPIDLHQGPLRVEAWVREQGKPDKGMRLVTVRRL